MTGGGPWKEAQMMHMRAAWQAAADVPGPSMGDTGAHPCERTGVLMARLAAFRSRLEPPRAND